MKLNMRFVWFVGFVGFAGFIGLVRCVGFVGVVLYFRNLKRLVPKGFGVGGRPFVIAADFTRSQPRSPARPNRPTDRSKAV